MKSICSLWVGFQPKFKHCVYAIDMYVKYIRALSGIRSDNEF